MLFRSVVAASALVAISNAQTIETSSASSVAPSSTVAQVMPPSATQSFNIGNVTSSDLFLWCRAQLNTCPQMCGGAASQNTCNSDNLQFTCVCANGTVPDSTAFEQTVPYYECEATYAQCINAHPNDAEGQQTCTDNKQCGTRNATAEAMAQTSAAETTTASRTSSGTTSQTATAASSGSSTSATAGSGASMNTIATGAFAAVFAAAFKLLL